jgi:serine/threonine protein kinase
MESKEIRDFPRYIRSFDRIFIDFSILSSPSGDGFFAYLMGSEMSLPASSLIVTKTVYDKAQTDSRARSILGRLVGSGLLRTFKGKPFFPFTGSYLDVLKNPALRKYNSLVITNDENLGTAVKKLLFDDTHINNIDAMYVDDSGISHQFVYLPQDAQLEFEIDASKIRADRVFINFVDTDPPTGWRYFFKDCAPDSACAPTKTPGHFFFKISRNALFVEDFDDISFTAVIFGTYVKIPGMHSLCDVLRQKWILYQDKAVFDSSQSTTQVQDKRNEIETKTTSHNKSFEFPDVSESERFPYHGGENNSSFVQNPLIKPALPKEGDIVHPNSQKQTNLRVGRLISDAGGEGTIYQSERPSDVLKIYKTGHVTQIAKSKIEMMVSKPLNIPFVAWPHEALYNTRGEFVGFSMPCVIGTEAVNLFPSEQNARQSFPGITRTKIVEFCLSYLKTVEYLHKRNIIIGDVKAENVIVLNKDLSKPVLVDCDSFQVGNFVCPVGTRFYMPPEICGKDCHSFFRTFDQDMFAVSAFLFMVIMYGKHPYDSCINPNAPDETYEQKQALGKFPYSMDQSKTAIHGPRGNYICIWSHLPGYLKKAFYDTFSRNGSAYGPGHRKTASQWVEIFQSYLSGLQNGYFARLDPEFDEPYPRDEIDYAKLDVPMLSVKQEYGLGFTMSDAIARAFQKMKETPENDLISRAVSQLNDHVQYQENQFSFTLDKNIGVLKRVSVRYQPI